MCKKAAVASWAAQELVDLGRGVAMGPGHARARQGGVTWCMRCGAYGELQHRGLLRSCPGAPTDASAVFRLRSLQRGLHPRSRAPLGGVLEVEHGGDAGLLRGARAISQPGGGGAPARMVALRARVRARALL